jgi:hypothetical protein
MRIDAAAAAGGAAVSFTGGLGAGTPGYMAPEVRDGSYTVRSEVYSLGVVLLEVLTGRRIQAGTVTDVQNAVEDHGVDWLVARADAACDWRARAKELLAALAFDCVRHRQDKRPASMGPVLERLRAVRAVVDAAGAVPLARCVVCLEDVDARAGIVCGGGSGGGHFICRECLPGTVKFNLEPRRLAANRGRVKCPGEGCVQVWEMSDFGDRLDAATHIAYGNALRYRAFDAEDARRAAEAELAAREIAARDARLALVERARQHRAVIADGT